MGTICSTTRSVRVRENKGGCDQTPPRNQQYKGATTYTHRYTSIQSKEEKSLIVANTYALESLQNELKQSEEQQHFIVTVDEPIKILPTQETEITDEQPDSLTNAVINTSLNEQQIDLPDTTESIESEIEIITVEQQPVKTEITDEQPESLTNAVINTSPNEPQIDLPDNTESIDNEIENEIENIAIEQQLVKPKTTDEQLEQQPVKTEITCEQPEFLTNAGIHTSPNEQQIDLPDNTESIANEIENIAIEQLVKSEITDEQLEQQHVKPEITELNLPDPIISTDPIQPVCTTELASTPIDTTYNISQMIEEPNLNITTGITSCQTEEYSVDDIPKSPASTNAFDNTLVMNSTVVGNETIEYPDKTNSPEITQGLETDLTNVTRELDEAATDIVESVLNKNIFVTPDNTAGIEEVPNGDI